MDRLRTAEGQRTEKSSPYATVQAPIVEKHAPAALPEAIKRPEEHRPGEVTTAIARSIEEIEALRPLWEQMQNGETFPTPNVDVDRYVSVVTAVKGQAQPLVMLFKQGQQPAAMVVGRIEQKKVNFRLGYRTLLRPRLRCLNVAYGGVLGQPEGPPASLVIGELMKRLRSGEADVIYFNHLRTDTAFYRAVREIPGFLTRDRFPTIDEHWRMSVPETMEQFYSARSRGHRHNLRKAIRQFDTDFPRRVVGASRPVRDYSSEADVDEFLKLASAISSKTYQNALGAGLADDAKTRSRLLASARHGWFRGHVLMAGDTPCAFQLALHYGNVYYMENIGYDPALCSYKPGLILFLHVLESLCADPSVEMIDFYFGDAEYKNRYGTEHWPEACLYIFAPRAYPRLINAMRSAVAGLNAGLRFLVQRTGSLARIKRRWRNLLSTAGAEPADTKPT